MFMFFVASLSANPFVANILKDQRAYRSFGTANNSSITRKKGVAPASNILFA